MTNQEAIESFKNANKAAELQLKAHRGIMDASEIKEMKWLIERDNLAIKALELEPCKDAVSRSEFEKRIKPYDTEDEMDKVLYNFAHNILISCPSVQPQTVDWDGMIAEIDICMEHILEADDRTFRNRVSEQGHRVEGAYDYHKKVMKIINKYRNGV